MHRHGHRRGLRSRNRRRLPDGSWEVRARVERFGEPALLTLISTGPTHGYELLERLPPLVGEERVDVGNLYRTLRALEDEGLVASEWRPDLPGPTKRTYVLTDDGREVLAAWLDSLGALRDSLGSFLGDASRKGGDHVQKARPQDVGVAGSEP
jgi:DNA-binding PadR family transcriptional regulator